ncbi:MAG: WS/DGAT domain-containing protein, partial [Anaerolineae bacterium]|nr:WS/DGAT domain-containing protein [Anaerolineae bacterium]
QKLAHDALHVGSVLADKELRRRALIGIANLVNDNLRPIKKLAINGSNSGKMTLAWASFSLAEVRAIRSNQRASVNDVMLTVLAGALDRYLEQRGENPDRNFVRVLVPVNMRVETEKNTFGNRISVLPIDIPFGISDPLERLARTAEYTQVMKESSLSIGLDIVLTLPALAPAIAQPLIWGVAPLAFSFLAHTWCTNVAGPQIPLYMLGHQLLNTFGYFPLNPSMGLACVITSYNQQISMTLVADTAIIPDADKLRDLLKSSFVNLRQAAKVQPIEPIAIEHRRSDPPPSSPPTPQPQPEKPATNTASNGTSAVETTSLPADNPVIESTANNTDETIVDSTANGTDETAVTVDVTAEPVTMTEGTTVDEVASESATAPLEAAEPEPISSIPTKLKLFSEEWAQVYRIAINNNRNYYKASTKWTAGSLAFVMQADARNGFPQPTAVLLDLYKGECRSAHNLSAYEARRDAAFVIEGDYKNWMVALSGQTPPLMMLMTRKLKLTKGSLTKLMPFTQSAQELITSAQAIP